MGDLNIDFEHPRDTREEDIADLLDEINLVDSSRKFLLRRCKLQSAKKRWTWRQRRMGRWHHSQPDYILAREGDIRHFRKVAFRSPRVHDSDHRAVVATLRARRSRQLTNYRRKRQRLPLRLAIGPQDVLTQQFEALKLQCEKADPKRRQGNDWISNETWRLISHRTMLRRTGQLCQTGGRKMQRQIWAALRGDRAARTAQVGEAIEHELTRGDVQEAFRYLKGLYRTATETTTRPCPQTMVRQTTERIALYARRDSPGEPLPINVDPILITDGAPTDGELREAVTDLTNGRAGGASGMRAEDVKAWLRGV